MSDDPSRPDELDLHIARYADWRQRYADLFADLLKDIADPWVEEVEISAILPSQGTFAAVFHMNVLQQDGACPEIELLLYPREPSMTPTQFRTALASALRGVADLVEGETQ